MKQLYFISARLHRDAQWIARDMGLGRNDWQYVPWDDTPANTARRLYVIRGRRTTPDKLIGYFSDYERVQLTGDRVVLDRMMRGD
jgi:hypothetical protein